MKYLRVVLLVLGKDLREELRRKESLAASLFFAFLSLILLYFALDPTLVDLSKAGTGLLWLIVLFAGSLFMGNSFKKETETGTLQAILLAPVDRSALYLGKFLANLLFLLFLEFLLLVFAAIFLNIPVSDHAAEVAGIWFLATVGYAATGTLIAALIAQVRGGQVLFPILLFPLLIPLFIAAVTLTQGAMAGQFALGDKWLKLVVVFDMVALVAPLFLFEYAVEE